MMHVKLGEKNKNSLKLAKKQLVISNLESAELQLQNKTAKRKNVKKSVNQNTTVKLQNVFNKEKTHSVSKPQSSAKTNNLAHPKNVTMKPSVTLNMNSVKNVNLDINAKKLKTANIWLQNKN